MENFEIIIKAELKRLDVYTIRLKRPSTYLVLWLSPGADPKIINRPLVWDGNRSLFTYKSETWAFKRFRRICKAEQDERISFEPNN